MFSLSLKIKPFFTVPIKTLIIILLEEPALNVHIPHQMPACMRLVYLQQVLLVLVLNMPKGRSAHHQHHTV